MKKIKIKYLYLFDRFIYWRIFCFVCEREPKRRPRTEFQRSISQPQPRAISQPRYSNRASIRRSVRISQRTADSGIDSFRDPKLLHAYSDTDLRFDYYFQDSDKINTIIM